MGKSALFVDRVLRSAGGLADRDSGYRCQRSMSHDIAVKQHGGTIDLATEPCAFTELLPLARTTIASFPKCKSQVVI